MARRGTTAHIDIAELEKLCAMQCTDDEIAAWFGVTRRTLARRRKVAKFADLMERGKAKGRISVRRMQMKLLEQGNATMGVWLGKQILGQTDQISHNLSGAEVYLVMPAGLQAASESRTQVAPPDDFDGVTLDVLAQKLLR